MKKDNPGCRIWIESYLEEAEGLKEQKTYSVLSSKEYTKTYGNIQVIPSICVQMVKPNDNRDPIQAKS
jgi:hypothetical protein